MFVHANTLRRIKKRQDLQGLLSPEKVWLERKELLQMSSLWHKQFRGNGLAVILSGLRCVQCCGIRKKRFIQGIVASAKKEKRRKAVAGADRDGGVE